MNSSRLINTKIDTYRRIIYRENTIYNNEIYFSSLYNPYTIIVYNTFIMLEIGLYPQNENN